MIFAGINYLAVLVAAIAGYVVGSIWYMTLGNAWMKALGKTKEELKPSAGPFIAAFLMQLLMAYILAGAIGHLGDNTVTLKNSVISAAFCWVGFVLTTMFVNHRFQGSPLMLTIIDAGHWLFVLLVMGVVIGLFGV